MVYRIEYQKLLILNITENNNKNSLSIIWIIIETQIRMKNKYNIIQSTLTQNLKIKESSTNSSANPNK